MLYRKNIILILMTFILIASCQETSKEPMNSSTTDNNDIPSLLADKRIDELKWMNPPATYSLDHGVLTVHAEKGTDFFNNP